MLKKLIIIATILLPFTAKSESLILKADNTVSLSTQVNAESVTAAMLDIQRLNQIETDEPILLVLNTPGGSVFDGLDFIRFAKTSRRPIHTVTIFAASMGFQIVQALPGKRYMAEFGVLMSHRAAVSGVSGQYPGELNVRVNFFQEISEVMDAGVAKRAGITLKEYQDLIHDEYYATPSKAISARFADENADLSCDASMQGTHIQEVETMFGIAEVTYSNCPLIVNFLKAEFKQQTDKNKNQNATEAVILENKKVNGRSL
jgi:ATP-dependent protease ClpP protease subunit